MCRGVYCSLSPEFPFAKVCFIPKIFSKQKRGGLISAFSNRFQQYKSGFFSRFRIFRIPFFMLMLTMAWRRNYYEKRLHPATRLLNLRHPRTSSGHVWRAAVGDTRPLPPIIRSYTCIPSLAGRYYIRKYKDCLRSVATMLNCAFNQQIHAMIHGNE